MFCLTYFRVSILFNTNLKILIINIIAFKAFKINYLHKIIYVLKLFFIEKCSCVTFVTTLNKIASYICHIIIK
jgi:hypothetical protein